MNKSANPYLSDPNMLLKLEEIVFNKHNNRIHNHLILGGPKLRFLGELLLMSKSDFDSVEKIGDTCLNIIEKYLARLSVSTGKDYKLRPNNHPPYDDNLNNTKDKEALIRQIYTLSDDAKPMKNPIITKQKQAVRSPSTRGFCADDFEIVATGIDEECVFVTIPLPEKLKDALKDGVLNLPRLNSNLISGNNHPDENDCNKTFCNASGSSFAQISEDGNTMDVFYNGDCLADTLMKGEIHIKQGIADGMTLVVQQALEKIIMKYSI